MTVLTGVSGHLCCAHRDEDGTLHGHTWEVIAWFPGSTIDARHWQAHLQFALDQHDHGELSEANSRGEALLDTLRAEMPTAVEIELRRPLERIYARWTA